VNGFFSQDRVFLWNSPLPDLTVRSCDFPGPTFSFSFGLTRSSLGSSLLHTFYFSTRESESESCHRSGGSRSCDPLFLIGLLPFFRYCPTNLFPVHPPKPLSQRSLGTKIPLFSTAFSRSPPPLSTPHAQWPVLHTPCPDSSGSPSFSPPLFLLACLQQSKMYPVRILNPFPF